MTAFWVGTWIVVDKEKILSFCQNIVIILGNCHPCHLIIEAAIYHAKPGLVASHEIWSWILGRRPSSELFTDLNGQSMEIETTSWAHVHSFINWPVSSNILFTPLTYRRSAFAGFPCSWPTCNCTSLGVEGSPRAWSALIFSFHSLHFASLCFDAVPFTTRGIWRRRMVQGACNTSMAFRLVCLHQMQFRKS